jgi:hypothetical protein
MIGKAAIPVTGERNGMREAAKPSPRDLCRLLAVDTASPERMAASLPFGCGDVTVGAENELQAAVSGSARDVDLPLQIKSSDYYRNLCKRALNGEGSQRLLDQLDSLIEDNPQQLWENSWVRVPRQRLSPYANQVFERDLLADKRKPQGARRGDCCRFATRIDGAEWLRIPVSYLLKLALADSIADTGDHPLVRSLGMRFMGHFLSDNTSPETYSFFPVSIRSDSGRGQGAAAETAKRYLLCQLLTQYANQQFGLSDSGQTADVYFAPHPPIRQKILNGLITDAFYRQLFMSPCLSGWDCGEAKHAYMHLCHQVLSRSQLNAVGKLKEAGIVSNNLIVLPNLSNISLCNNGTHLSFGSRKLSALAADAGAEFGPATERYVGDLVIKIVEHFLPLFVGTYSAAPYRLDFADFHPEVALGFLPHELDFTHLRMIWRRWKKKARIAFMGRPITPFGPEWLDRGISRLLRLKGDYLVDFRLIDYLVCLLSTETQPALSGEPGREARLKQCLASLGVFDDSMAMYLLFRLREQAMMGFSGYEARHFSLFESLMDDMGPAVDLQRLLIALAYKYVLSGQIQHRDIPDLPAIESERRQVFFGTAIGIPTFFVQRSTPNRLMQRILRGMPKTRASRRYPGTIRVPNSDFRRRLLAVIRTDAPELVEMFGLDGVLADLDRRLNEPATTAADRLTTGILSGSRERTPMAMDRAEFATAAEAHYRGPLRIQHMSEAMDQLAADVARLDRLKSWRQGVYNGALLNILGGGSASDFLDRSRSAVLDGSAPEPVLRRLIHLTLLTFHQDMAAEMPPKAL